MKQKALVERLRQLDFCAPGCYGRCIECPNHVLLEAAFEIERLQAQLNEHELGA